MGRRLSISVFLIAVIFISIIPAAAIADNIHWAQSYVDQLDSRYPVSDTIIVSDYDNDITLQDLESLLECTLGADVNLTSTSRQEVISKLIDIYVERTGIDLDNLLFVALVPFEDFEEIDPRYTRNIMYAYSSGLIKGRGSNMLAPNDDLSYAEAFVLVSRLEGMAAEDSFNVDVEIIKQDSTITFDFKLVNRSGKMQDLTFSSSQIYELVVYDRTGQEVYRFSDHRGFLTALEEYSIDAGDYISGQLIWDMKDKGGNLLPPGRYNVEVTFIPMESRDPYNSCLSAVLSFNI